MEPVNKLSKRLLFKKRKKMDQFNKSIIKGACTHRAIRADINPNSVGMVPLKVFPAKFLVNQK